MDRSKVQMEDQVWVVNEFPVMFDLDANETLNWCFSLDKILVVLKYFRKEKFLGQDGWIVELFTHFFDLTGGALRDMIEESRIMMRDHLAQKEIIVNNRHRGHALVSKFQVIRYSQIKLGELLGIKEWMWIFKG